MPNDETRRTRLCSSFGLRVSLGFRVSSFGFGLQHSPHRFPSCKRISAVAWSKLIRSGSILLLPGSILLPSGSILLPSGSTLLPSGDKLLVSGSTCVVAGYNGAHVR